MFKRLLLVLFGLLPFVALAQITPVAPPPTPTLSIWSRLPTKADTARAIHELFRSRRGGGAGWLGVGTAGIAGATLPALQSTSAGVWMPGVVAGAACLLIGLNKELQFRRSRERRILREYAATGQLPYSVFRRLHGNFLPVYGTPTAHNDPAFVQAVPVALSPEQRLADARLDTLDAVQGLLLRQRRNVMLLLLVIPATTTLTVNADNRSSSRPASFAGGGMALTGLAFVGLTLHMNSQFNTFRTGYLAGQPVALSMRQKLRPRDMQRGRRFREKEERKQRRG